MRSRFSFLLLCFYTLFHAVYGQNIDSTALCEICKTGRHRGENPYTLNIKKEIPFIVTSSIALAGGFITQATTNQDVFTLGELNNLDKDGIFFLDRSSALNNSRQAASYSDFFRSAVTFFPVYFLSNHYTKQDIGPLLAMSTEVFAMTFGLTNIAKNIVRRPRPFTYNPDVPLEDKMKKDARRSFFSGHTSHTAAFSFFMAKVITDYHPNAKKGLKIFFWTFAATIPAVTGYLRVKAGRHFPTDVITGYMTGALVGYLIPHLHKKKKTDNALSWSPIFHNDYTGLALTFKLR